MSRFAATFERLRARGERALMPYIMAGDPSLEETRRLVLEAEKRGADADRARACRSPIRSPTAR